MVPPYDRFPCPPHLSSVTTILYLECEHVIFQMSTNLLDNDIANTPAGAAFKGFLRAVKGEEGYESITWGPTLQDNSAVLVFISMC